MEIGAISNSTIVLRRQLGLRDSSGQDVYRLGDDLDGDGAVSPAEMIDRNCDGTIIDEEAWEFFVVNSYRLPITQVDPTIQALVGNLSSTDPQVVIQAVALVGSIGLHNPRIPSIAITSVISLLNSSSADIREAAEQALCQCRSEAIRPHIASLEHLVSNPTTPIETARAAASALIRALSSNDQGTLQLLVRFYLRDNDVEGLVSVYRRGSRELLRPALPYLAGRIVREDWIFDQAITDILRGMIELDATLAPRLIPVLLRRVVTGLNAEGHGGGQVRLTIQALIAASQNPAARGALLNALDDRTQGVRATAAYVLSLLNDLSSDERARVLPQLRQGQSIIRLIEALDIF